jgi:hypothetical protein
MYPTGKKKLKFLTFLKFFINRHGTEKGHKNGAIAAKSRPNGEPCLKECGRVFLYDTNVHTYKVVDCYSVRSQE